MPPQKYFPSGFFVIEKEKDNEKETGSLVWTGLLSVLTTNGSFRPMFRQG